MIKAIIFDLGNVIVSFDHRKTAKRLENFCDHSNEIIFDKAITGKFVQDYNTGKITTGEFFAVVKSELGLRLNYEDFYEIWNCTFSPEAIISEELIKNLAAKYKLLILSDTNEMHFAFICENFRILKYFGEFIVSHEVNAVKPSAEIFRIAVEKAGCLAEECLFIDDIAANAEGARQSGINALQFVSPEKLAKDLQEMNLI